MNAPKFLYDELSDTLNICFRPGTATGGFELHDSIYVKWDSTRAEIMGLFISNYNILSQETESGAQSLLLTGLARLPQELREAILTNLRRPPIDRVLTLSSYRRANEKVIPIATIRPAQVPVA